MQASVKLTGMEVFRDLRSLGKEGHVACARSLNRTAQKGKAVVVAEVADRYQIAPEKVKKTLKKADASADRLWASITSKSRPIPLFEFGGLPREPFSGGPRPVGASVNVLGTRRFVHQKPKHPAQMAFIARLASGHIGIFARTGEFGRIPQKPIIGKTSAKISVKANQKLERIAELYTLPVPKMIEHEQVHSRIYVSLENLLQEETDKEYKKAVKSIFKEWAGK